MTKSNVIQVRVSDEEKGRIKKLAESEGKSISDYLLGRLTVQPNVVSDRTMTFADLHSLMKEHFDLQSAKSEFSITELINVLKGELDK